MKYVITWPLITIVLGLVCLDCRVERARNLDDSENGDVTIFGGLTDISPVDFSFEKTFYLGGKGLILFFL